MADLHEGPCRMVLHDVCSRCEEAVKRKTAEELEAMGYLPTGWCDICKSEKLTNQLAYKRALDESMVYRYCNECWRKHRTAWNEEMDL